MGTVIRLRQLGRGNSVNPCEPFDSEAFDPCLLRNELEFSICFKAVSSQTEIAPVMPVKIVASILCTPMRAFGVSATAIAPKLEENKNRYDLKRGLCL